MKKRDLLTIAILLQSVVAMTINSNNLSLKILTINEEKGLFTDDVRCVFQDDRRLLWIGTDEGLYTYDGYHTTQINARNEKNNKRNIGFTKVVIQPDSSRLLVGTYSGLYTYDKMQGVLRIVPRTENLEINDMACDNLNQIWLATYAGIYLYSERNGIKKCNFKDPQGKIINDIKCILFDSKHQLWFGTWANGLFRYNPQTDKVDPFPRLGEKNSPHVLFEDNEKRLLIGTWGDGLYYFDLASRAEEVKYRNIRLQGSENNGLPSNIIYSIGQDKQDRYYWIGGRKGLCILERLDQPQWGINISETRSINNNALSGKDVNSICVGRDNTIWLGILGGGINRISMPPFSFSARNISIGNYPFNHNDQVDRILPITSEKIWVSIPRSRVVEMDMGNSQQLFIKGELGTQPDEVDGIANYIRISEREYIINFSSGLLCRILFSKEGKVKQSTILGHHQGRVYSFAKSNRGIYFSTKWRVGIVYANNQIEYLPHSLHNPNNSTIAISAIAIDSIGDLWIASINNHLIRIRERSEEVADFKIVSSHDIMRGSVQVAGIYTLFVDSNNRLLVGTNGSGLFYFDSDHEQFEPIDERLRNVAETIFDILEDQQGRYWLNTNRGLMSLEVDRLFRIIDLRTYDLSDGLPEAKVQRGSLALSADGTLFCGHRKGFSFIKTTAIVHRNKPLVASIIDIKVGNQSFEEFALDQQWEMADQGNPYHNRTITLKHNQNNIGIELGVINHLKPKKVIFGYKLEGYSKEWTYVSSANRTIVFPLLNSGHYKLWVKVSENNVEWGEEVALMNIIVQPPWWNTWWAQLFYCILALIIGYAVVYMLRNKTRLDQELKMKELERKNEEILTHTKLQFFTNISHELLTPLTILSMMVEDLKAKYKDEDTNFNIMSINIERLIRLFQQILEFRKAETRNLKLKVRQGDIAQFIRNNCHSNFHPLIQRKGIHFSVACSPLQINGYFDIDKIDKILYNLLSNAIKYTPRLGNVQVTVKANDDQSKVTIIVHDTGIGIAPENIPHIFERFYDGEYRKMEVAGHGIGLSLTKELVALHKGTIVVESQLGIGTDFTVELPIDREIFLEHEFEKGIIVEETKSSELPEPKEAANNAEGHPIPILLVDDNEDMLYSLQLLMEKTFKVHTATNGLEAFAVLEKSEIELVISDVAMPELDGFSLCSKLKQELSYCHIPVILLTAKSEVQDKISGYDAGADGYITKPFNLLELQAQINSILKSRSKFFDHFKNGSKMIVNQLDYTSLDEQFLNQAIEYIEKNISNEEIDFDLFASHLNVSRSVLYRKTKLLTSVSPNEFVRKIRLNMACRILREKKVSISEVAFFVGFSNPKYFSTIFRKEFGCTPTEYAASHNHK